MKNYLLLLITLSSLSNAVNFNDINETSDIHAFKKLKNHSFFIKKEPSLILKEKIKNKEIEKILTMKDTEYYYIFTGNIQFINNKKGAKINAKNINKTFKNILKTCSQVNTQKVNCDVDGYLNQLKLIEYKTKLEKKYSFDIVLKYVKKDLNVVNKEINMDSNSSDKHSSEDNITISHKEDNTSSVLHKEDTNK